MLATWRWRRTLQPNLQGSVQRWVQPTAFTQPQPSCQTEGVFLNFELTLTHKARNTIDPFIDPSSTLHWSLHRSFIDPSSILHRPFIDFWSKCWFGADVGDGHFYRESLCENDNSMKQETHKCRFFFQMLIWRWRWRCGSVTENPCARMRIPCQALIQKAVFLFH